MDPKKLFQNNRREFIYSLTSGIGAVALTSLLGCRTSDKKSSTSLQQLATQVAMTPPRAKACIFLTMEGGPSQIDTFDPKPALTKYHLTKFNRQGEQFSAMSSGHRYIVKSPFSFIKAGESGADMCEHFVHLSDVADEICFYRGLQAQSVNHPTAMYHINTGNQFGGEPSVGSWISYGLGSINNNLPSFIVLPELAWPQGGPANWSNGFLPAKWQGTPFRPVGSPIVNLDPPPGVSRYHQERSLGLLQKMNTNHYDNHRFHEDLSARIESYELAFKMQMDVPDVINIDDEPQKIKEMYGIGDSATDTFGRKCLLARKLVEEGVRFVQLYSSGWDSHDYLERAHGNLIKSIDQPIAALIKDLKQRGMLDETLIVWCGEFGRTPDNGIREGGIAYGRDHNPNAMAVWMAGGGVKAGHTIGATDDLGENAADVVHPISDFHTTILHLMGLEDHNLTYFHNGRHKQLSQFGGKVISPLLA